MPAAKQNNNTATAADSTGGFKTVAFGFDKNDVTMYIASLRRKMKQMEDEFQSKLKEASDNPSVSKELLKHERDAARTEFEIEMNNKLGEHKQILKQYETKISRLEEIISEKDEIIASLKSEISAAASADANSAKESAKAAEIYTWFTNRLRSVSISINDTLNEAEGILSDELKDLKLEKASSPLAPKATKSQTPTDASKPLSESSDEAFDISSVDTVKTSSKPVEAVLDSAKTASVDESASQAVLNSVAEDAETSDNSRREDETTLDDIFNSLEGLNNLLAEPVHKAQPTAKASAAEPTKNSVASKLDVDDDLTFLVVEDEAPEDDGDFSSLFVSGEKDEDLDDIDITENVPLNIKGDDLDVSLLSDVVIDHGENKNGDLAAMLKKQAENEYAQFEDMFIISDDDEQKDDIFFSNSASGVSSSLSSKSNSSSNDETEYDDILLPPDVSPKKVNKKEADLFDFSFLSSEADDEDDDMSADISDSGML